MKGDLDFQFNFLWIFLCKSFQNISTINPIIVMFCFTTVFFAILVSVSSAPQATSQIKSVTNTMSLHKIEELIKNGSSVNSKDDNGDFPIHVASALGEQPVVDALIKNGADVNVLDKDGRTPLHRAVSEGHVEVVELLIENNVNISIRAANGESATDIALKRLNETETSSSNYSSVQNIYNELQRARTSWKTCKAYTFERSNRILNGEPAEEREFPWMAALGYLSTNYRVTFDCGGTVISENFILTAAHCARTQRPPIVCRLGKLKLVDTDDDNDIHRPTNVAIKQIIRHPFYSHFTRKNDIALIRVSPIQFSNNISPACLHTDLRDEHPDVKLVVTGWGSTTSDGAESHRSNDLLKAQLITVPLSQCNEKFKEYQSLANDPTLKNIGQSQYCAYDPQGRNDSCQGDSGGPLQLKSPYEASPTIVGVVSVGLGCGAFPGIYTRIAYYLDWIEPIVWPLGFIPKVTNK
ncbi:serine protease persephone-like [Contarinia nasturtii]|uniref:serine protease persephone-like n=1 Tax=Contarinia nasturtii TaxID=265458 RepID=UPI0012D4A8C1|nr:serine protease persephone-like [Contarinia nasturtii]